MDNEENLILDQSFIDDGRKLVGKLDSTEVKPSAILWFYFKEQKVWRLLIADSYFNELTAINRYKKFMKFFDQNDYQRLKFENIALLGSTDQLISLMKVALVTDPNSISETRFQSSTINGFFVDDALIYRLS